MNEVFSRNPIRAFWTWYKFTRREQRRFSEQPSRAMKAVRTSAIAARAIAETAQGENAVHAIDIDRFGLEFDNFRDELAKREIVHKMIAGAASVLMPSMSVGFSLWTLRGSSLIGMMPSSLPSWVMVDPLAILGVDDDVDTSSSARASTQGEVDVVSAENDSLADLIFQKTSQKTGQDEHQTIN